MDVAANTKKKHYHASTLQNVSSDAHTNCTVPLPRLDAQSLASDTESNCSLSASELLTGMDRADPNAHEHANRNIYIPSSGSSARSEIFVALPFCEFGFTTPSTQGDLYQAFRVLSKRLTSPHHIDRIVHRRVMDTLHAARRACFSELVHLRATFEQKCRQVLEPGSRTWRNNNLTNLNDHVHIANKKKRLNGTHNGNPLLRHQTTERAREPRTTLSPYAGRAAVATVLPPSLPPNPPAADYAAHPPLAPCTRQARPKAKAIPKTQPREAISPHPSLTSNLSPGRQPGTSPLHMTHRLVAAKRKLGEPHRSPTHTTNITTSTQHPPVMRSPTPTTRTAALRLPPNDPPGHSRETRKPARPNP